LLYALGLMAKPQVILLPFVLLLWDYWPLERISFAFNENPAAKPPPTVVPVHTWWWLLLEKIPLFAMGLSSAVITMKVQHGARNWFPRSSRAGNVFLSYMLYLRKTFWPSDLALFYPHPGASISWPHVVAAAVTLLFITGLVLFGRRYRYLSVGWCWFIGMLVPMLGIVQVGAQAMADRYTYLSVLGIFIMVCWGAADFAERRRFPTLLLPVVSVVVLLALALVCRHQIGYWDSNEAVWAHTLQITRRNPLAEDELGGALARQGRIKEAMPHFYTAIGIDPYDPLSNDAIAIYQLRRGDYADAIAHYNTVVKYEKKPNRLRQAYLGMAAAYRGLGEAALQQEYLDEAKKLSQ
jgi:tetratricopeptide (TPR) repeat protein